MSDSCQCTEKNREPEEEQDCQTCGGTGESSFSPDHPCSSCGYSGIGPSFWTCTNCGEEIEDLDVFGEEEEEVDFDEVNK